MALKALNTITCKRCGQDAYQELWSRNGRTYESVICKSCGREWGRLAGSQRWHELRRLDGKKWVFIDG